MNSEKQLALAIELASVMHEGQFRKGTGEPYFNHVKRVASRFEGWQAITVAYMHDLVEDTAITLDYLRLLRFDDRIIEAIDTLSRRKDETYAQYIERCIASDDRLAWVVKLADLDDNMRDIDMIPGGTSMKQKRYAAPYARFYKLVYGIEP